MRHRTLSDLEQHLDHLRESPRGRGTLELVVARPRVGKRTVLDEAQLDEVLGLVGDSWSERRYWRTPENPPNPLKQITVMNHRMVALLSESPEEQALAGDQLYVDLDLSVEHLPAGSRLAVGSAVIEVSEPAHTGCKKFVKHFGEDAMRFVNGREGRQLRLRGLNARVVVPGPVRPRDLVVVL